VKSPLAKYVFVEPTIQIVSERLGHLDIDTIRKTIGAEGVEMICLPSGDWLWFDKNPARVQTQLDGIVIADITVLGSRCLITGSGDPDAGHFQDFDITLAQAMASITWNPSVVLAS